MKFSETTATLLGLEMADHPRNVLRLEVKNVGKKKNILLYV